MKVALVVGVLGLSLSLVGCGGGSSSPTPAPTVTVTATPEPTKVELESPEPLESNKETLDQIFLSTVRKSYPQYRDSDKDLLELSAAICRAFNAGLTRREVLDTVDPNGGGYLSFIAGAAVGVYCPEHRNK